MEAKNITRFNPKYLKDGTIRWDEIGTIPEGYSKIVSKRSFPSKRELENASSLSEKDIQTRNQQIEKLQRENQEISGVYNQYQYLNTILEESTGAYQRWLDAQSAASAGDYGENIGKAFNQIQSVVNKGKGWGTTAFKASVELMLPEDVSPEDQDAIAKWKTKVQKYFKQDGSLNEDSFLNDLFTKGLAPQLGRRHMVIKGWPASIGYCERIRYEQRGCERLFRSAGSVLVLCCQM